MLLNPVKIRVVERMTEGAGRPEFEFLLCHDAKWATLGQLPFLFEMLWIYGKGHDFVKHFVH